MKRIAHAGLMLALAAGFAVNLCAAERLVECPPAPSVRVWPSEPPAGCPFPPSADLPGLGFTGRQTTYTGADTWYPSWAADGHLYSPWTDGNVNGLGVSSAGADAATGNAKIIGDDPLKLEIVDQVVFKSSPSPYTGRYPCGSLFYKGVWYYGTYCLHPGGGIRRDGIIYNWPWLGPFVGFRWSTDFGRTWTQTPHTPEKALFGESALNGEPVRIGAPHFVDLGKELEHSPDGKAYLVAHGASQGPDGRRYGYNSWITGDEIYLARVTPSIANMNDASKYEFFAGDDAQGKPTWTSDLAKSRPIAAWKDNMGCVTMTYNAPLKKYLMWVTDGGNTVHHFNTYLLESDRMTGPWKLVTYMKHFGEQAYFVNVPTKFISADGRTMWLWYSANFSSGWGGKVFRSNPPGSRYALCVQELQLLTPAQTNWAAHPLMNPKNVARFAKPSVSSLSGGYSAEALVDGRVGGYPANIAEEWASNGERDSAIARLTWDRPVKIDRMWLFDRPNDLDQVQSGLFIFSDGSTLRMETALPDDAKQGVEITFAPRTVKWVAFFPDRVKDRTLNIGLAEWAVFEAE